MAILRYVLLSFFFSFVVFLFFFFFIFRTNWHYRRELSPINTDTVLKSADTASSFIRVYTVCYGTSQKMTYF